MGPDLTRRDLLATGAAAAALAVLGQVGSASAAPRRHRHPDSLPYPHRPAGTPNPKIPIDHVVVVMMENHSFDNYFGMLPNHGQSKADGFTFNRHGRPINTNPVSRDKPDRVIRSFRMPSTCQPEHEPSQSWDSTHIAMNHGNMDGFVEASGDTAMGYWNEHDLPFYYSIANTFTLANRWFTSTPCQTYPNRRYLMAGTSWGLISTTLPGPNDPPPPNGTIFDRLSHHGISWKNYFTDLPQTLIIPSVGKTYPLHLAPIAEFFLDAAAGTLPAVSYVDPDFGLADAIAGLAPGDTIPASVRAQGQDEENPQNIRFGEAFVAGVVNAVINSPAWHRTMLIWLYDEHGGYYDHVPPPPALAPDHIKPQLNGATVHAGFDSYGPRVPAVVVSPWARPHAVTNTVHDHTSVLAFIEQKWNLPAMTRRDANANSLLDFLDLRKPRLLDPPALTPPAGALQADRNCDTSSPTRPVVRVAPPPKHPRPPKRPRPTPPPTPARSPGGRRLPNTGGEPLAVPGLAVAATAVAAAAARRTRKACEPTDVP